MIQKVFSSRGQKTIKNLKFQRFSEVYVASFCFKRVISKKPNKRKQSLFLACFHFLKTFLKSKLVGDFKNFDLSHKKPSLFSFVYLKTRNSVKSKQKKTKPFLVCFEIFESQNISRTSKYLILYIKKFVTFFCLPVNKRFVKM